MSSLWRKLKYLIPFYRRAEERDLQDELNSLRTMAAELGNLTLAAENVRGVLTFAWLEHIRQDLRLAVRALLSRPAFTALAALTLALGIGLATATFSVVDWVLIRSLPFFESERLADVWITFPDTANFHFGKRWPF